MLFCFFVRFFCPNHVTVLNIAVCACTLKLWNLESFPGRFVVSVTTSIRCDSGKLVLLARSASGLYSIFKRIILFQSISSLLCLIVRVTVVDRLKTTTFPSFADNPHTLKKTTHHLFQIPGLSTVHRHIYFLKRKKKQDCVRFEMTRREHWDRSCVAEGSKWYLFSLFSTRCAH